ncbi:forkhead box protein R1-like [Adelges cooleyi]|uniref:forkhead box protein R1-like n=1 Tax=Adelges cooleyi TaxID=133065 RepID=UPI00218049C7|nr:forkhead box protein R1-like [Adelges cooleyi]
MSSTVTPPNLISDGLSSLVLSKRYLAYARPPHLYKLEHEQQPDPQEAVVDWQPTAWVPTPLQQQPPIQITTTPPAVQARFEPSDVFTPLVFEAQRPQQPPPLWKRTAEQMPRETHIMRPPQPPHPAKNCNYRSPQPSPPDQQANRPDDFSWLVNFQVASIFETNTTVTAICGNADSDNWHEQEVQKQKRKVAKPEQKPVQKINRKPYRLPPSRLDKANKPGYTYTEMIHQALMEKKELPVAEIYHWISSHFPYFREDDERWKNSVRHNLSINPNFRKGRKSQGAGHYWRLCNTEESLGQREYTTPTEEEETSPSPQESSELEQACKYLESELQRDDSLDDVKLQASFDSALDNEMYTNSFLISSPAKYVGDQISISNNDFHSYGANLLEESIDFQYYNL